MTNHMGAIREFVVANFLFGEDVKLEDGTSFLESGIIDSTGMLELVGFLEERFGIHIADEELVPENLDSLSNISAYLAGKLDGKLST
jgi:acyl carrier protein